MERFENVSVVKKANLYFEGKVSSRTIFMASGEKKTLGIMLPGEYEFGTDGPELMEILGGSLDVKLPGNDKWQHIDGGQSFEVPANSKFTLVVNETADYCCSYK